MSDQFPVEMHYGELEVRLLIQPPCEWENEPVWGDEPDPSGLFPADKLMLRSEHCISIGYKYCPMCGRWLEAK